MPKWTWSWSRDPFLDRIARTMYGTEFFIMCWCAVKKLLTHSLAHCRGVWYGCVYVTKITYQRDIPTKPSLVMLGTSNLVCRLILTST